MKPIILMIALVLFALAGACGSPCNEICDNHRDCEDASFDSSECANVCEDRTGFDNAFQEIADLCLECLDDAGSCAEQDQVCTAECDPVINDALREGA